MRLSSNIQQFAVRLREAGVLPKTKEASHGRHYDAKEPPDVQDSRDSCHSKYLTLFRNLHCTPRLCGLGLTESLRHLRETRSTQPGHNPIPPVGVNSLVLFPVPSTVLVVGHGSAKPLQGARIFAC